ncbi:Rieske 2Fe-2S domain-containing protein [Oceanicoccus sp. KOV_DT_Chl]|uniref:Rieske 2Fe-2S domain-containing protein n=1 Tax=Oceanicoccus sp. KOV_DT_Chl TaxID=1904639 RepID=UPI000C7B93C4|nr:Rieske 2Fe-2S domain-containing protein [Oceanicoccus sp. KOV_DT_Chl]
MTTKRHHLPIPFGWYCIAYSDEIAVAEVKPVKYLGQELVLYRTESGTASVSEAYCPHLGAHIGHGGLVIGEYISCPFHGWQFNGEGHCAAIPYAKAIPKKIVGVSSLFHYPVVEANGVVWFWYHPERVEPLFEVEEHQLIQDGSWLPTYRKYEWIVNTAVQETAENAADQAHFVFVHGSEHMPKPTVEYAGHQRSAYFDGYLPGTDPDGPERFEIKMLTANSGPGHTWQHFSGMFESFMLGLITPIDSDSLHMRFAFVLKDTTDAGELFMLDAYVDEVVRQVEQDIPIWNHKTFRTEPALCDGDGPIAQFRKWFRQFYAESDLVNLVQQAELLGVPTLPMAKGSKN